MWTLIEHTRGSVSPNRRTPRMTTWLVAFTLLAFAKSPGAQNPSAPAAAPESPKPTANAFPTQRYEKP